ncbi:hypothetical protein D3C72_759980 [compost metagenome]
MITLDIAQDSEMVLFTGCQALLEREAFLSFGTLLRDRSKGYLIERFDVQAALFGELVAISPVLDLPGNGRRTTDQDDHQHAFCQQPIRRRDQFADTHSTALARSHSSSRSCRPLRPPLILRVIVLNSF